MIAADLARSQVVVSNEMITITADSLVNTKINGEIVQKLLGNVRFQQADLSGSANEAWQFQSRNVIELRGKVNIVQDFMTMQAKENKQFGAPDMLNNLLLSF